MLSSEGRLERPFVLTSAVKKGVEMVLMALGQNCPVLLHGPAGSGKTGLIRKLAEINQNQGTVLQSYQFQIYN